MSAFQLGTGDSDRARLERNAVEPAGVVEHGRQPPRGDVGADSFHYLDRSQRLAEGSDRAGTSLWTDHVAPGGKLAPQFGDRREGVIAGTVDPAHAEGQRRSRATRMGHCGRPYFIYNLSPPLAATGDGARSRRCSQPLEDPGQLSGDHGFALAEQAPGVRRQEQVIAQRDLIPGGIFLKCTVGPLNIA